MNKLDAMKAVYKMGIDATYLRDREMKTIALVKYGIAQSRPAMQQITELTNDCEEIVAIDYDLERQQLELLAAEAAGREPLIEHLVKTMEKQTKRRGELLAAMPGKKEAARKLLE